MVDSTMAKMIPHADFFLLSTPVLNNHALQIRVLAIVVRPHAGTIFGSFLHSRTGLIPGFTHAVLFLYGFCGWSECMCSSWIDLWAAMVPSCYSVFCCVLFMFLDRVIHPHAQAITLLDLTQQAGSRLATSIHDFL